MPTARNLLTRVPPSVPPTVPVFNSVTALAYASRTNSEVERPTGVESGDLLIFGVVTAKETEAPDPTPEAGTEQLGTTITHQEVPEPGTLGLFGVGLAGLWSMRRKRRA